MVAHALVPVEIRKFPGADLGTVVCGAAAGSGERVTRVLGGLWLNGHLALGRVAAGVKRQGLRSKQNFHYIKNPNLSRGSSQGSLHMLS